MLVYAVSTGSLLDGAQPALLFGLGAAASPLYCLGAAAGRPGTRLREQCPRYSRWLRPHSEVVLGTFGLRLHLLNGFAG